MLLILGLLTCDVFSRSTIAAAITRLRGSPALADNLVVVQKLARHRQISTTAIYDKRGEVTKLKAVVLVRIDSQPHAMKISLIGVRLSFRGQFDEICPHSVSDLRTL